MDYTTCTCEYESLLIGRDAFLVLNLRLDMLHCIRGLDFQRQRFASERFDEDLHAAAETKNEMKSRLFLDVIIRQCATIFELFS